MKDLFGDYSGYLEEYTVKKDLYNKGKLYQMEILDGLYDNLLENSKGPGLFCIDYMKLGDYMNSVSKQFVDIVKEFLEYLGNLETDLIELGKELESKSIVMQLYGYMSFGILFELLDLFKIEYRSYVVLDETNNQEGIGIDILENGEYVPYTFWSKGISLVNLNNGEVEFNSWIEYLFGSEFIMFYINYLYNNDFCRSVKEIYDEYTKLGNKLV